MPSETKKIEILDLRNWSRIAFYVNQLQSYVNYPYELQILIPSGVFAMPGPTLILGSVIQRIRKYRREHDLDTRVTVGNSYLSYIGFSWLVGAKNATEIGLPSGSPNHVPIRKLEMADLVCDDTVTKYASNLSEVISPNDNMVRMLLKYTIQELLRNIAEHSEFRISYLMGQRYRNGTAEIAIVDDGRGVTRALRGRYPEIASDSEAVEFAIEPGVTSGSESRGNAGFGLYVLSELGHRYGAFLLGTGSAAVYIKPSGRRIVTYNDGLVGTHVSLYYNYNSSKQFREVLREIVEAGERKTGSNTKSKSKTI